MKKNVVIIILSVLGAIIAITIGVMVYSTTTPKYSLLKTARDIDRMGFSGLEMHLTDSAKEALMLPSVSDMIDDESLGSIFDMVTDGAKDTTLGWLKAKLGDCQWSLVKITQKGGEAEATIRFNYNEKIIGTIPITMLHEDGEWKIDGIGIPSTEKLDLYGVLGE